MISLPDEERDSCLDDILQRAEAPTASAVYALFARERASDEELFRVGLLLGMDSHESWWPSESDDDATDLDADQFADTAQAQRERWGKTARQAADDALRAGEAAPESLTLSLRQLDAEPMGLDELLRQFAAPREALRINPDEFDYIYYAHGLRVYGNMPLVEPLEYADVPEVRTFVLVIDASGSVDERLAACFVRRACGMLLGADVLGESGCVHVLQCDDEVRDVVVLRSAGEVEDYARNVEIKGRGGTDFRPAFAYAESLSGAAHEANAACAAHAVDAVCAAHEAGAGRAARTAAEVAGLLYFTDGKGVFPETPPPFDAAFVFVDEARPVPPWATMALTYSNELTDDATRRAGGEERER